MTDKQLAEIVCRALLAIVAALRKRYELPEYRGVTVEIRSTDSVAGVAEYPYINQSPAANG